MGARAEPWRERVNAQSGNGDNNGGKWPECGLCSLHSQMDLLSEAASRGLAIRISHSLDSDFSFSRFRFLILPIQISHSPDSDFSFCLLDKKQLGDGHANGRLLLGMTVMLAWSNRCVPLNKLNC